MIEPTYTAVAAITIDGKIARSRKHFTNWTSREDKKFLHRMIAHSDVIVVGETTYEIAQKELSRTRCIVLTRLKKKPPQDEMHTYCNTRSANIQEIIRKHGYQRVVILGGMQTYSYFLEQRLLDELYITIEPIIFGKGLPLFQSQKCFGGQSIRLVTVKKLNAVGSLLLHYRIKHERKS